MASWLHRSSGLQISWPYLHIPRFVQPHSTALVQINSVFSPKLGPCLHSRWYASPRSGKLPLPPNQCQWLEGHVGCLMYFLPARLPSAWRAPSQRSLQSAWQPLLSGKSSHPQPLFCQQTASSTSAVPVPADEVSDFRDEGNSISGKSSSKQISDYWSHPVGQSVFLLSRKYWQQTLTLSSGH